MHANLLQKQQILRFWDNFGGWHPSGGYSQFQKELKLKRLMEMASIMIPYRNQTDLQKRRHQFNESKRRLCRQPIGSPCFACGANGFNRHHIIQLQNGGINSRRNLVILCDDCHAEIHPWLKTEIILASAGETS